MLREPGGVKEGCGDGHLFPLGPCWETWERATMKHRGLIFIVFNNMIVDRVHKVNDFKSAMSNMMP